MPFVKVDCAILNSTLWFEKGPRDVFLTALLMAEPFEAKEPLETYTVDGGELDKSFTVPPGWYGFVRAAGSAIVRYSMVDDDGMEALKRLSSPDSSSRTPDFEGRRMVRVNGGFIVLNYQKYRDRDYTSAERSARYRERKKERERHGVASPNHTVAPRDITQAEGEGEAEVKAEPKTPSRRRFTPPTKEEVWKEFASKGRPEEAEGFWGWWGPDGLNWSKCSNWKMRVRSWLAKHPKGHPSAMGNKGPSTPSRYDHVKSNRIEVKP